MSAIARKIQDEQGWTDATLLDLCLQYIENQQSDAAFTDFLTEASADGDECPRSSSGNHTPDPTAITPADGAPWTVDVPCVDCGRMGSVSVEAEDIQW